MRTNWFSHLAVPLLHLLCNQAIPDPHGFGLGNWLHGFLASGHGRTTATISEVHLIKAANIYQRCLVNLIA